MNSGVRFLVEEDIYYTTRSRNMFVGVLSSQVLLNYHSKPCKNRSINKLFRLIRPVSFVS